MNELWGVINSVSRSLLRSLFKYKTNRSGRFLNQILLVILFLFGVILWVRFLNYGDIPDNRLDWGEITFARLSVIQEAVQKEILPLHIDQVYGIKGVTNRYLVVPDLLLSPQVILLKWLSIEWFILIQVILLYSISFYGLLLSKRKYQLSLMAFLPLFLLFNFNGHITSHLSVGHLTWTGYFLLPFYVLLLLDAIEKEHLGWGWVAKFSLVQFCIFLQGGYHLFVWLLFFMGLLLIRISGKRLWVFWGIIFSILLNFYRVLPGALLKKSYAIEFWSGFPTSGRFFLSFLSLSTLDDAYTIDGHINIFAWELNYFLGAAGFLVLVMGIIFLFKQRFEKYAKLYIPIIVLVILSIGNFYKPFFDSRIPLFSGERISARFLILPVVIIIFLASLQLQKLFDQNHQSNLYFYCIPLLILLLSNDLVQNLGQWQISNLIEEPSLELFVPIPKLVFIQDPTYINLLSIGAITSLICALYLIIMVIIEIKQNAGSIRNK